MVLALVNLRHHLVFFGVRQQVCSTKDLYSYHATVAPVLVTRLALSAEPACLASAGVNGAPSVSFSPLPPPRTCPCVSVNLSDPMSRRYVPPWPKGARYSRLPQRPAGPWITQRMTEPPAELSRRPVESHGSIQVEKEDDDAGDDDFGDAAPRPGR
ncbi:hypothetical protein CPLU01_07226 [Colletotrichum plurivorum]|uniref:Uncharacterized protein n=1 Tax=Colletotrichum plurivorum TaxID=2175906 RepID=A0A8H6NF80_9PEZI|nr:hypothetical protein CPLU01_07226 [Colletotrichum plurivorum]